MGPNADEAAMFWGNYNGFPLHPESLLGALLRKGVNVEYLPGVPYVAGVSTSQTTKGDVSMKATYNPENIDFDYDSVIRAVVDYETIIFAGGIASCLEGEVPQPHPCRPSPPNPAPAWHNNQKTCC